MDPGEVQAGVPREMAKQRGYEIVREYRRPTVLELNP
jgi:hypothetical protein